jgi:hypothetical protein
MLGLPFYDSLDFVPSFVDGYLYKIPFIFGRTVIMAKT